MKGAATPPPPGIPTRTCLGCGAKVGKAGLLRFVARAGVLLEDQAGRVPGRGAYCCRQERCLKKIAARKGRLSKALRQEVFDCRVALAICAAEFADELGRV